MGGFYVTDQHVKIYQDTISHLREDLGRLITINLKPIESICSNCEYDSINKRSSSKYKTSPAGPKPFQNGTLCPQCRGAGKLLIPQSKTYQANIRWRLEMLDENIDGKVLNGDVKVKVELSAYEDIIAAVDFVIDGVRCTLSESPVKTGLRDLYNCVFWCKRIA
jgi:hypothetical protein